MCGCNSTPPPSCGPCSLAAVDADAELADVTRAEGYERPAPWQGATEGRDASRHIGLANRATEHEFHGSDAACRAAQSLVAGGDNARRHVTSRSRPVSYRASRSSAIAS